MADDGSDALPAGEIEVTLFRQILLVPFAIETLGDGEAGLASGRVRVDAMAELLREPWKEITRDRWRHLHADASAEGSTLAAAYAEFVYFEPAVQRFLFGGPNDDTQDPPIRLWQRTDLATLDVTVGPTDHSPRECWRLHVDRLNLYLFDSGNATLVAELVFAPGLAQEIGGEHSGQPKLDRVMRLVERIRRVFPPFFVPKGKDGAELLVAPFFPEKLAWQPDDSASVSDWPADPLACIAHVADRRVPPLHPAWRGLVQDLPVKGDEEDTTGKFQLAQLGDDRAFSIVVLGVKDVGAIGEPDWVRLAMCDGPGPGWPYGRVFLQNWANEQAYDRHFDTDSGSGTRYLFSGYSFATVGTARRPDDPERCNFRDLFSEHGRRHYFQLCLIAHFQKSALLTLSERLADALRQTPKGRGRHFHAIERDILQFTHRYWFESFSAQVQAQEIFDRLRRNLRLRPLYDQARQEVREADAHTTSDEQQRIARNQNRLNIIAGAGLTLAVVVGIFGMNVFHDENQPRWPIDLFTFAFAIGAVLACFTALYAWAEELESWLAEREKHKWLIVFVPVLLGAAGLIGLLFR